VVQHEIHVTSDFKAKRLRYKSHSEVVCYSAIDLVGTKDLKKDLLAEPPSPSPAKTDLSPDSSPSPDSSTTSLVYRVVFLLLLSFFVMKTELFHDKIVCYVTVFDMQQQNICLHSCCRSV